MPRPARLLLASLSLSLPALAACAHSGSLAGSQTTSSAAEHPRAPRPVPVERGASPAPHLPEGPRYGCDVRAPLPTGFHTDDHALTAAGADANASAPHTNGADVAEFADGHVRISLPAAWFPSRVDGSAFTAYRVRTGEPTDAFGFLLGDAPAFRPHAGDEFRLALGSIAVRGTTWLEGTRRRMEALALLPCASPRFVHVWADSDAPDRFARMVSALRSLRIESASRTDSRETAVDPARDRDAVAALTASDPLARQLADRALAANTLRATYPLDTRHPLADQVLFGHYDSDLAGAHADVLVRVAVTAGRAHAPGAFRALDDGSLARGFARLAREGCAGPAVTVAHDGLAVRCTGEPELRAASRDEDDPAALVATLDRFARARATLARWRREPALAGGWPASLCDADRWTVVPDGGALFLASDRCVLVADPAREALFSAAAEGECAQVPTAPWAEPLRQMGRFDEVRGQGGSYCRYSLGWNGRSSWVIAVGDAGTASAPIAHGPTMAADRRGVNTAVAFVHELLDYAMERSEERPANVLPSVLQALGVDRPGSPEAQATLQLFAARGGLTGPGTSAVVGVRAPDAEHLEVTFVSVVVELSTANPSGQWVVTNVRPAAWGAAQTGAGAAGATSAGATNAGASTAPTEGRPSPRPRAR